MRDKTREGIEQLKTVVDRVKYNYTGWESVFHKKKYANLQFVERTYEIINELYEQLEAVQKRVEEQQMLLQRVTQEMQKGHEKQEIQKKVTTDAIEELNIYISNNEKYKEQLEKQLGATARQLMKVKWQLIDGETERIEKPEDILHCKICGNEERRDSYQKKITECRFNGGTLVRYICPKCGVIFGPTKFSALTQDEINDDYSTHYMGFQEGDSTKKELDAFYMLKPDKNKMYLNYGCGSWSKSLQQLRAEGYQVYGYEPYAPETDNPYMVTDKEKISKMRFDGIYSNDVIEHLINPVEEFIFMKGLLKDKHSKMSHSTSCYIYKHEVTRFHTHFFTGKSIEVLCEKAGLNIIERVNEVDSKDFICYVYEPKAVNMDYTDKLLGLKKKENGYILPAGEVMYGPYLTVGGNVTNWKLSIAHTDSKIDKVQCRITEQCGKETLQTVELSEGENVFKISLSKIVTDMEFVIENQTGHEIEIQKLEMLEE